MAMDTQREDEAATPSEVRHTRDRNDWVVADLRCMLCGRVLGRLVGPLPPGSAEERPTAWRVRQFSAFRPADQRRPAVRLTGTESFRCTTCGGAGVVDEPETFTIYDDVMDDTDDEHRETQRPRRGRPPKPWRRLATNPLATLGLAG